MKTKVQVTVNGCPLELWLEPGRLLIDVLRNDLGLVGTKLGCGMGICGTCTVLVDGRPVSSCLMLASLANGREVVTIEGLSDGDRLDPVQVTFLEVGAFECGFCTPGMIMSARALLNQRRPLTREEIAEFMGGNLCRCTGYADIVRAIELATQRERAGTSPTGRAG